ncbi:bifunctional [glutamate--ammonia ligase]-adenylyl-L-tyrosine phosphorylase/[glutamate--ammonia-ligase] adenylyltransferase [Thioalkalivibrio sp. XN279]|uniref:bifunctional [glutamate--ammonia ligase]-adenylyl-L-tyrosine phosphorylase/[glutamate--ammonia-ligase] adenylyltransferase n=1 Tax=Thioalkalivibrio sp. XN279 TaxID=2714953 RepID=UPI00140736D8|nr:bifunctional [glutamate--ammonia ligase]-adenylyl-L-tyrosine phosphorylase/[glutamate--ammonia-ligase] adenylyltransferase [Thioalkalivibrio sp. XN279]NHA16141.1 bifunctional [glutamate--ammonia ligase]-adenylyl-L-tyrosine phosphorylase/[glutamate--ammonia-ligase] adenylyltransferase [Thioalkalivibrio sp. XN279]
MTSSAATDPVAAGLAALPEPLQRDLPERWRRFAAQWPDEAGDFAAVAALAEAAPRVWAASEFVVEHALRGGAQLHALATAAQQPWTPGTLLGAAGELLGGVADEAEAMTRLRAFRRGEMLRIAWRDLAGWAVLEETLGHLSELAEVCIRAADDWVHARLSARHGQPRGSDGVVQRLLVIAMGKLGGGELNFSSDIDLVFLYPEAGETDGERPLSNEQFFTRAGRELIRLLDEVTADGFVFRVDMRLRPFGESGPLAMSLTAFANYLQQHGRAWERYAYVKARAVTGHRAGMGLYRDVLRPFVFRRYLDFGLFEALRDMKQKIAAEVERRELRGNIKLGRGGIREIEFIVQCLQLLRGGADPRLRQQGLPAALARLEETGQLPAEAVQELRAAWRFLRLTENRLQAWQDRQTHDLPTDEVGRLRLAFAMGCEDWQAFRTRLDGHLARVDTWFRHQTAGVSADQGADGLAAAWRGDAGEKAALDGLAHAGYAAPERALEAMRSVADAGWYRRLDETARQRLGTLVPALARGACELEAPEEALERLLRVVSAIGGRSAYFALLNENPAALRRFITLCGGSEFLAGQVAVHPLLLDDLIDPRVMESPPGRDQLGVELEERLAGVEPEDLEGLMDALRNFQRAAVFRVAVADLTGRLPVMKVSDQLTWIAEVLLEACVRIARDDAERRHGRPLCGDDEDALSPCHMAVIGYGKLGGIELGYGSDLDLVFVHDAAGEIQRSEGPAVIETGMLFARMTRRIVHLLATPTGAGVLYEVDTRLRPSGKGGLLVTGLNAFESYQRERAWTWEHQALLRARAVAGDPGVRAAFAALRERVLVEAVRRENLRAEVAAMRERMRSELSSGTQALFDIKQDAGGVADIEFMVQYLVLQHAAERPALLRWSDNVRQLEDLRDAGLLDPADSALLHEAYLEFRQRLHRQALAGAPGVAPVAEVAALRDRVQALWQRIMEAPGPL